MDSPVVPIQRPQRVRVFVDVWNSQLSATNRPVGTCCHCGVQLSLTEEKGVDVAIATDMIKLAWEDAYDWAVLVSSDRDFTRPWSS